MKKIVILLSIASLLILPVITSAQITWKKNYGLPDRDENVYSMIITTDSNYLIAGTVMNNNFADCLFLMLDKYGDTIWAKSYGGAKADVAYCVQQTFDGGFIAGGVRDYFMDSGSGNLFGDMWIMKLDILGDTVWTKTYSGTFYSFANSIVQNIDSTYTVAGVSDNSSPNVGGDIWILKLDTCGNIINSKTYGSQIYPGFDRAESIRKTFDGNTVVVGTSSTYKIWVLKLDANCDTIWSKSIEGTYAADILQTSDSGYVVIGRTTIDGDIYKLNQIGDTDWTKKFELPNGFFSPTSIEQTADNGFVVCGTQADRIGFVKLDATGDTLWSKMYNCMQANWNDFSTSALETFDGGYIFAGTIKSAVSGYDNDISLVKTDENGIVSISKNNNINSKSIEIYPSPATINITIGVPQKAEIDIYNIEGQIIKTMMSSDNGIIINIENFSSGVYVVKAKTDKEILQGKFIKQ
ncbi:MAG: T9SS type A sorting domain-containing protein [Bacteroidetes bacterium]|nr:T9SS type A sorting domain-containing protein [Bacteroidota bacterium]MBU1719451.1 T9SS type A sorting domain-containing protein [Bacteroidota bacterium]